MTRNPKSYGAKGDNIADDTVAIQKTFDAAKDGDAVTFPANTFRTTRTVTIPDKAIDIASVPSAAIRFHPAAGQTICLSVAQSNRPAFRRDWRLPNLIGPTVNKDTLAVGTMIGLRMYGVYYGCLRGMIVNGFDGAGVEVDHCHYWRIEDLYLRNNGIGLRCNVANAVTFINLKAQYNLYGVENAKNLIGGAIEGNFRSGARYTEVGHSYAIRDVWFEANGSYSAVAGESDIWCNSLPDWTADAGKTWKPVILSIDGSTVFMGHGNKTVATHNIAGCMNLSIGGAVRFYESQWPNFRFHPWCKIADSMPVPMDENPQAFDAGVPANYRRSK